MSRCRFAVRFPLPLSALSLALSAFVVFAVPARSQESLDPAIAGIHVDADRVEGALQRAGSRRPVIESFLSRYEGEEAAAARFLVSWMPTVDLTSIEERDLAENLELAFRARRETAYGHQLSDGLFLHYVLPHRATQERFEPHRRDFFEALMPIVSKQKSMVDVALAVNRWCARRIKFKQTEFRDQSASATARHGLGRCEELMIYAISALRAVGIPARPCSAPWWVVSDNNHAWVEVWVDGSWSYLGACEGSKALGRTWFRGTAQRAGHVVSRRYGAEDAAPTGDIVRSRSGSVASIDSTSVYARTQEHFITLRDPQGQPLAGVSCAVSVWNFGALRALLRAKSGEDGVLRLRLGLGEYFVSAGDEAQRGFMILRSEASAPNQAELVLREDARMPTSFWMRYPTAAEARRAFDAIPGQSAERPGKWKPEIAKPAPLELYAEGLDPALDVKIAQLPQSEQRPQRKQAVSLLESARGNWRVFAELLRSTRLNDVPVLLQLCEGLAPLDRYEVTAEVLRDHLRAVLALPESKRSPEVLAIRVHREHVTAWRGLLQARFAAWREWPAEQILAALGERILPALVEDQHTGLGPQQDPLSVARSGHADAVERAVYGVAVLRSLGIAARYEADRAAVLWRDGATWRRSGWQGETGAEQGRSAGQQAQLAASGRGALFVTRSKDGKAYASPRFLGVSRWSAGMWTPLRLRRVARDGDALRFDLPHGRYLVTSGIRNPNGDAYVQCREIEIGEGEAPRLAFSMDLPSDSGIFRFPIARKVEGFAQLRIDGQGPSLAELTAKNAVLLFFGREGHEPSIRAGEQLRGAWPSLEKLGVEMHVIQDRQAKFATGLAKSWVAPQLYDALGIVRDDAGSKLPALILIRKGGRVLLWTEGYDPSSGELLRAAARQIQ
jgi:transglutaminase-like putative cysteine protease